MEHYREYQCGACDYYFSHPIDRCPICGDQFFWLLMTDGQVEATQKQGFVSRMIALGGTGVTEEFLTFRDRLWLPYNFWEKDPGGESLHAWPFVKDVKLYQHKKKTSEKKEDDTTIREAGFETNPAHPIPDFSAVANQNAGPSRPEVTLAPSRNDNPMGASTPALSPYQPSAPVEPMAPPRPQAEPSPANLGIKDWLPPILIFVFFMLLSLSFLVLRYHRNDSRSNVSLNFEATYDRSVLS